MDVEIQVASSASPTSTRHESRPLIMDRDVEDLEAGPGEQSQCRICLESDGRDFIAPCKCKGSSKFVHRSCLDHWRSIKEGFAFAHCTTCKSPYYLRVAQLPADKKWRRFKFQFFVTRDILVIFLSIQLITSLLGYLVYMIDNSQNEWLRVTCGFESLYKFYYICGASLFFSLLGVSGCFLTCFDRRVRNDLAQPCREVCLCCCHPGICADCHLPGTLCMWTDCTACFEGCAATMGECGTCLSGAGEAGAPVMLIMGLAALALFAIVGIFYSVLVATMVCQRIWQRHYHILAKRMLTKDYIVEDLDGEVLDGEWTPPPLPAEHVHNLKSLGLLMPVTPSYSWKETPVWVTVEVALRSVPQSTLDILSTECYIKVNCLPYFFQADLYGDIDTHKSSAVVENNTVKFFLVKKKQEMWGRLTIVGDRNMIEQRRQQSLDAVREAAQKTKEEAAGKISQIRRLAVGSQMKLEEVRRKTIEGRKEAELKKERDGLHNWQDEIYHRKRLERNQQLRQSIADSFLEDENPDCAIEKAVSYSASAATTATATATATAAGAAAAPVLVPAKLGTQKSSGEKIIPAPRKTFSLEVSFTPTSIANHLPARESREKQIQLKKQQQQENADTLDVSEREPLFLQDKADKFYRLGDYRSAINAYTDAIKKDPSSVLCHANRAACFLQTNQLQASINDCTRAMDLLLNTTSPLVEEEEEKDDQDTCTATNKQLKLEFVAAGALDLLTRVFDESDLRRTLLTRRASGRCHQGNFEDASVDLLQALKMKGSSISSTAIEEVLDCIKSMH